MILIPEIALYEFSSIVKISVILQLNLISPPSSIICFLIEDITFPSTSVPMCGLFMYNIDGSAPNSTKVSSMHLILPLVSFIIVFSFPSENVPAPPSPNCTFDSVSSSPVFQKFSTVFLLSSTGSPRSITIGLSPASASFSAANIPAGPNPAITGLLCESRL